MSSDILHDDPHDMVGAYALDAVEELERKRFEQHLSSCETCRDELRELQSAVVMLGDQDSLAVPAGLRDRVLESVARDPGRTATSMGRPDRGMLARLALVAAALVAVVFLGISMLRPVDPLEQVRVAAREGDTAEVERLVSNSNDLSVSTGSANSVRASVVRSGEGAVLIVEGLDDLSEGQTYQAWLISDATTTSAGLLGSGGNPVRDLDTIGSDIGAIGITAEPDGGSDSPSTPPVVEVPLT